MITDIATANTEAKQLVSKSLEECCANPIDFFNNGGEVGERSYIEFMRIGYERAVSSVLHHLPGATVSPRSQVKILETASYLGVVAVALAKAGYSVVATDIPEYINHSRIRGRYAKHSIEPVAVNLRSYPLPWSDSTFDAILFAEVLEHLNFNPVPVLLEFNRILKPGGCLYIATPNATWLPKRLRFLKGDSIHDPIRDFFSQLTAANGSIVGIHWREYTQQEMFQLLGRLGFSVESHQFVRLAPENQKNYIRRLLLKSIYTLRPDFLPHQLLWAEKSAIPEANIKFTDSTAPLHTSS